MSEPTVVIEEILQRSEQGVTRVNIPDSWWFVDEGVPANVTWDEIVACLERCHRKDFWDTP